MSKRFAIVPAAAVLVVAATWANQALAAEGNNDHRRSMGNLRPDHPTATPSITGSPPTGWKGGSGSADHGRPRVHRPYRHHSYHDRWYYWPPGYVYDPYYPYLTPRPPYYWDPWRYPYYGPPYYPVGPVWGAEGVRRFLGLNRMPAVVNRQIIVVPKDKQDEKDEQQPVPRSSNARAFALGWQFIDFGDGHFNNQKYADAYQRYKRAARAAPTLADAYFRQGFALIALGNYEQAANTIKRGLELDPDWARSDFHNDELYGGNEAAKTAHLDALGQAATDNPNDADLQFLVGVFLHFEGQPQRAKPFFERAARMAGDTTHLAGFLGQAAPAAKP